MKLSDSPRSDGPTREAVMSLDKYQREVLLEDLLRIHAQSLLRIQGEHSGQNVLIEYDFDLGDFVFVDSAVIGHSMAEMMEELRINNPGRLYFLMLGRA